METKKAIVIIKLLFAEQEHALALGGNVKKLKNDVLRKRNKKN